MSGTRKRAPGAGRKPRGEYAGKTATITTRITPAVRAGLEREARRNGRSLSQEIEKRLDDSLKAGNRKLQDRAWGLPRHKALAAVLANVLQRAEDWTGIEGFDGRDYRRDPFTFEVGRLAFALLLERLRPVGEVVAPSDVLAHVERMKATQPASASMWDQFATPEGRALSIAGGLFDQLMRTESPPPDHPGNEHYADGYYRFPKIRQDLGLKEKVK